MFISALIVDWFYFAVPDEFQFDPLSKTYGDPSRRPEIKSATIEFIAPSEYMVSDKFCLLKLLTITRLATSIWWNTSKESLKVSK